MPPAPKYWLCCAVTAKRTKHRNCTRKSISNRFIIEHQCRRFPFPYMHIYAHRGSYNHTFQHHTLHSNHTTHRDSRARERSIFRAPPTADTRRHISRVSGRERGYCKYEAAKNSIALARACALIHHPPHTFSDQHWSAPTATPPFPTCRDSSRAHTAHITHRPTRSARTRRTTTKTALSQHCHSADGVCM